MLLTDGIAEDALASALHSDIYYASKRHKQGLSMINMIAGNVTALGLLGTYVGLIPMINNMDDPESLGPMMAIELVSSFYGAFIAYTLFTPMGKRLEAMSSMEVFRKELITEGLMLIQKGKNPKLIQDQLLATLRKKDIAKNFGKGMGAANKISAGREDENVGRRAGVGR